MASQQNEMKSQIVIDLENQLHQVENDYTRLQAHLSSVEHKYQTELHQLHLLGENAFLFKLQTVIANFYNQPLYSDIIIKLENGHQLYGHKLVLTARSENWGLINFYQTLVLDLSGVKSEVATILIKWVYTDRLDGITVDLLIDLIKTAGWFNIDVLKLRCEKELISMVTTTNCQYLLEVSDTLACPRLKEVCTEFLHGTVSNKSQEACLSLKPGQDVDRSKVTVSNHDAQVQAPSIISTENEAHHSQDIKKDLEVQPMPLPEPDEDDVEPNIPDEPEIPEETNSPDETPRRTTRSSKTLKKAKTTRNISKSRKKATIKKLKPKFETSNLKCNDCHRKFTYKDAFDRHIKMHKGDNCAEEIKADIIKKLNQESNFNKVSDESDAEIDDHADIVGRNAIFPDLEDLDSSEETKELESFSCSLCPKSFPTPEKLKRHTEIHGRTRKHKCPEEDCGKSFFTRSTLKQHMLIHSNEKPYQCEVCQKPFRHSSALSVHLELHARQGNIEKTTFPCEVCGLKLATTQSLQRHILNKHTDGNVKPIHQCNLCGQLFGYRGSLKAHMKKHNGEGFTQCDICGREFKDRKNLKSHLRTHSDAKPYQCPHCNYTCKHSSALLNHVRRHTGDRPHVCDICGKTFISTSERKRHSLIHTGDKPFSCPICGKAFRKSHHVKQHFSTHKNEGYLELGDFGQPSSLPLPNFSECS